MPDRAGCFVVVRLVALEEVVADDLAADGGGSVCFSTGHANGAVPDERVRHG